MIYSLNLAKKEINKYIKYNKINRVLVLSGKNSFFKSGANFFLSTLLMKKETLLFLKKSYFPEFNELKKIIYIINKFKPNLIIAVGGGSVIDYAKIANIANHSDDLKKRIINYKFNFKKKFARLIAIPTTAGSGAEVTENAVIYVNKVKYSVEGPLIKPDLYFLIPELINKSPKKLRSSAGFDAISQSLESLISIKSSKQSLKYATRSLKYSLKYFIPFLKKPNFNNTTKMSLAANLSGSAISISKTTAPHAISYPFTSHFGISHGHAVSLTLEKFLKFNFDNAKYSKTNFNLKDRYEIMFKLTKTKNIFDFINYLKHVKKQANLNDNLSELGININKDFNKIISGVNLLRLKNNPVLLKQNDLRSILINE